LRDCFLRDIGARDLDFLSSAALFFLSFFLSPLNCYFCLHRKVFPAVTTFLESHRNSACRPSPTRIRRNMSAILSADDLNDFISPGVACIKPIETLPVQQADNSVSSTIALRHRRAHSNNYARIHTKSRPKRKPLPQNRRHPLRYRLPIVLPARVV
jgi:hypothetical protein